MVLIISLLVLIYLVCAVLAYGLTLGYFQTAWPMLAWPQRRANLTMALTTGLLGPVGIIVVLLGYKDGWHKEAHWKLNFRTMSRAKSLAEFQHLWPNLDPKASGF